MAAPFRSRQAAAGALLAAVVLVSGCSGVSSGARSAAVVFDPPQATSQRSEGNPSSPNLHVSPDGRFYMVWAEKGTAAAADHSAHDGHTGQAAAGAARIAASTDGRTWSAPLQINDQPEGIQGDENMPRLGFGPGGKLYAVWSVPGAKGDKMRANIRFAVGDGEGTFAPAQTLNEIQDTARFPSLQVGPDGTAYVIWIDRRVDQPEPRQIYLSRFSPSGEIIGSSQKVGGPSCECCRTAMALADGGRTVYLTYRGKTPDNIRDIMLQKSTDGGATFSEPVAVSNDGWQINACPHAGAVIAVDKRGDLHVTWYTQGREPKDAGVYYTVSRDGGRTFAPRMQVHAAVSTTPLHPYLAVGEAGDVFLAWDNFREGKDESQIFFRTLTAGSDRFGPVQQLSRVEAAASAIRPNLAVSQNRLVVAWTETKGERSWIVTRSATVAQ